LKPFPTSYVIAINELADCIKRSRRKMTPLCLGGKLSCGELSDEFCE
jgi:hypothetical protein